jgi:ATP-dependent DNA helicase RecG
LGVLLFAKYPERFIPSAYIQYVRFAGTDNAGDVLQENVFKGPLIKVVQELDVFIKTGPAAVRPVLATAMREDPVSQYSAWALREFLMNAIIHRDYFLGNAPIKFYEYKKNRIEISNPGGLFGRANPDNFPFVNDYRNPLLAEAMKILGMVNKYNRGIAKANKELEKNGNPKAQFDVNKLTEFRVTVMPRGESGQIKWPDKPKSGTMNGESIQKQAENDVNSDKKGRTGVKSGQIKWPDKQKSGQIKPVKAYDTEGQDSAVLEIIRNNPGIKMEAIFLEIGTSTRSVRRVLERLSKDNRIEYRGSQRTGGWFVKT